VTVRSIPSHAAFPLANASVAAEGKEIRFTVNLLLTLIYTFNFYRHALLAFNLLLFKIFYAAGEDLLVHEAVNIFKEARHISFTVTHLA
jgi:hypothetical protein